MRTNLTKALGISLLAIVGILAVNASAAHATWTLLKNNPPTPIPLLILNAQILEGELLVPGVSLNIKCTGGTGSTHFTGGTNLQGITHVVFTGCKVLNFANCEVRSDSTAAGSGSILAKGQGLGSLAGTSVSALVSSTNFTTVIIENELCPFNETEEVVKGGATLLLLTAATNSKEHLAHLNDDKLFFGQHEAFLDGVGGADTALAHVTEATGGTWAIDHS